MGQLNFLCLVGLVSQSRGARGRESKPRIGLLKYHNWDKCILQSGQIHFTFGTITFYNLDKYSSQLGQIHFAIEKNEFPLSGGPGGPEQGQGSGE